MFTGIQGTKDVSVVWTLQAGFDFLRQLFCLIGGPLRQQTGMDEGEGIFPIEETLSA